MVDPPFPFGDITYWWAKLTYLYIFRHGLTIEDIRAIEDQTQEDLEKLRNTGEVRGTRAWTAVCLHSIYIQTVCLQKRILDLMFSQIGWSKKVITQLYYILIFSSHQICNAIHMK